MVGESAPVRIDGFLWEYEPGQNVEHFARHDVSPGDVFAMLEGRVLTFQNLPGRTATHVLVGKDGRGRVLYVAMIEADTPGIWKPISGWESRQARRIYDAR